MIYPKFLKNYSCIGVVSPSDGLDGEADTNRFKNAIKRFNDMGYKLVVSSNLFKSNRGRSASAIDRANEINDMFNNKGIDITPNTIYIINLTSLTKNNNIATTITLNIF